MGVVLSLRGSGDVGAGRLVDFVAGLVPLVLLFVLAGCPVGGAGAPQRGAEVIFDVPFAGSGVQGSGGGGQNSSAGSMGAGRGQSKLFGKLSSGGMTTCGIALEGEMYCWGDGTFGKLGNGDEQDRGSPTLVSSGERFRDVSVGERHVCAIDTSNRSYCWGSRLNVILGLNRSERGNLDGVVAIPTRVDSLQRFSKVSVGERVSCAINLDQRLYCWGSNSNAGLALARVTLAYKAFAPELASITWERFVDISLSLVDDFGCAISTRNKTFCWGPWENAKIGVPAPFASAHNLTSVDAARIFVCGMSTRKKVVCWGNSVGANGSLFNNNNSSSLLEPTELEISPGVDHTEVATSHKGYSCSVGNELGNSSLWCWGFGIPGTEVAPGAPPYRTFTKIWSVEGRDRLSSLALSATHACLLVDLVPHCWGSDSQGQLGNGDLDNQSKVTPTRLVIN